MKIIFESQESIHTGNYLLKRVSHDYDYEMFLFRSDEKVCKSEGVHPDKTIEDTALFIDKMIKGEEEGMWVYWFILNKHDILLGSISIWNLDAKENSAELGYGIRSIFQNQGIMSEILPFVEEYAFNKVELSYLHAFTNQNNLNSIKLLNKLKYKKTGEVLEENQKGEQVTMIKFSKTV